MANQGCKGGQNVGRNDRLWHLKKPALPKAPSQIRTQTSGSIGERSTARLWGSRGALAPKKPFLIKNRKPRAKSGRSPPVPLAKEAQQGGNGRTIQEFCLAEFFAEKNAVSLANQDCKGGQNGHVDRAKRVETSWGSCKIKINSFTQRFSRFRIQPVRHEETPTRFLHKKSGRQPQKAALFAALHKAFGKQELPDAKALVGVRLLRKENAPHF